MKWQFCQRNRVWFAGPQNRIRIALFHEPRGEERYRLWDDRDWSGMIPGAAPTWWAGQMWHRSLQAAQDEAERLLAGIEHQGRSADEFDKLIEGK